MPGVSCSGETVGDGGSGCCVYWAGCGWVVLVGELMKNKKIIRVFPRRTNATPDDDLAFMGDPLFPGLLPAADEVHVSCAFSWDRDEAERLGRAWEVYYPGRVRCGTVR